MIWKLIKLDKKGIEGAVLLVVSLGLTPLLIKSLLTFENPHLAKDFGGQFYYAFLALISIASPMLLSLQFSGLRWNGKLGFLLSMPIKRKTLWISHIVKNLLISSVFTGIFLTVHYKYISEYVNSPEYPLSFAEIALNTLILLPLFTFSFMSLLSTLYLHIKNYLIIPIVAGLPFYSRAITDLWILYDTNFNHYCMVSLGLSLLMSLISWELFKRVDG